MQLIVANLVNLFKKTIRSTKNVGFTKTKTQFDIVYNAVEFELRRDFRRPDYAAVFNSYSFNIDDCTHFWRVYTNKYKFNINNQLFKLRIQSESKFQQYGYHQSNYRPGYVTGNVNKNNFRYFY